MNNGVILHLENQKELLEGYKALYAQLGMELEYMTCTTSQDFNSEIEKNGKYIKAIIFDLIGDKATEEEFAGKPEFLAIVDDKFVKYNIPIFIYSGHLESLGDKYDHNGTVYKISKDNSIEVIFEKIKFLYESGFIDVFCPGGILESEIKSELNKSFTQQFSQNDQIEEVLKSILNSGGAEGQKERVKNVFKRIAIKTLASDLLAPVTDGEDKVHPIEHFYKRQNKLPVWTGDIWRRNEGDEIALVLTPRCDLATNKAEFIMVCRIESAPKFSLEAKPEKLIKDLNKYLVDNIDGKAKRYIPSNVFFPEGGLVNLAKHSTISKEQFVKDYLYVVTLSDDLTNEIIGKFAYYFLRTGIMNINEREFEAIIKAAIPENAAAKNNHTGNDHVVV